MRPCSSALQYRVTLIKENSFDRPNMAQSAEAVFALIDAVTLYRRADEHIRTVQV